MSTTVATSPKTSVGAAVPSPATAVPITVTPTLVPAPTTPARGAPPDMLNSAVTQATVGTTICVAGYTATIRPSTSITNRIKVHQLAAYGYGKVTPGSFEEDHVIALELGGAAAAPANLYPEPLAIAGQDDALENALHRQVCSGRLTLAAAQVQVLASKSAHGYRLQASIA